MNEENKDLDFDWPVDTEKNLFNVGDRVYTKHTGLPQIGTVIGAFPSIPYLQMRSPASRDNMYKAWAIYDKEWWKKYMYYVRYDKPSTNTSWEEYVKWNPDIKEEKLKESFTKIPKICVAVYGEFDLGLLDDTYDTN